MTTEYPEIKGIFIKAHIDRMRQNYSPETLRKISERFGKSLAFKSLNNYPMREEDRVLRSFIEETMPEVSGDTIDFEAGRFHWQTFSQTMIVKTALQISAHNIKRLLSSGEGILQMISIGLRYDYFEDGEKKIRIIVKNCDYEPRHFEGMFCELMKDMGYPGTVETMVLADRLYEYRLKW